MALLVFPHPELPNSKLPFVRRLSAHTSKNAASFDSSVFSKLDDLPKQLNAIKRRMQVNTFAPSTVLRERFNNNWG